MFTQEEIRSWENEQSLSLKNSRKFIDPRKEKLKDFRKGIKSVHFNKESKMDRKHDYRLYRTRMKRLMYLPGSAHRIMILNPWLYTNTP
ncbi:hypothetical protein [Paenibacillus pabuli]|nr:hypothetical protein [Paenibacillus pabuli]